MKLLIKSNYLLFKGVRKVLAFTGYFRSRVNAGLDEFWANRIEIVTKSPDNEMIPRVTNAGEIVGDTQVMHNGIRIHVGSYYGDGNTVLLKRNRGVHEPQEERAFEEVLGFLPENAAMLELGAFWAFYSMSFKKRFPEGTAYLIEPDIHALWSGKHNFRLNGFNGNFSQFAIGASSQGNQISVDDFMHSRNIPHLHLLHSDIQGYELEMLKGAVKRLRAGVIDYVFISTHSNELHETCKSFLEDVQYVILCDANLEETYSWDGLIVAKNKRLSLPLSLEISKRS